MPTDPDRYKRRNDVTAQPGCWLTVEPSDSDPLPFTPKALWVDVGGNLALVGADGHAETFTVLSGLVPLAPAKILAAGTTATGIKILFDR